MPIVGDVLADRYRIESVLGVGGMASVYLATDLRLDRQVAVKVLVANLAADAEFAERFNREAGAMAGFSHPNVAAVYDVEPGDPEAGREPFYVMEYCEGGSLADRLHVAGRMPPAELIPVVAAISEGLAELHRGGLIHRDIKPANILFASDRPKLADFGVAWSQEPRDGAPLTLPGSTLGTVRYLAPELAAGEPPSAASDVYALGVTMFEALTGQYPQPATAAETGAESQPGIPVLVSASAPDLGRGFDAAMARALDPDGAARPSPTEFAMQLAAGLKTSGVARPNPGAVIPPSGPSGEPRGADLEAPTVVIPTAPVRPPDQPVKRAQQEPASQEQPAVRQPTETRSGRVGWGALAILVIVLAVLAVGVLPRLLGGSGGPPVGTAGASAAAASAASATARPIGNETLLVALGRVDAAIEAARGGKDGLKGRDANELADLAAAVRKAVDRGDLDTAITTAGALSDRGRALTTGLDRPRRDPLLDAIAGLSQVLAATR